MPINLIHLPYIRDTDRRIYETFVSLKNAIESLTTNAGVGPSGNIAAPATIQNISVAAANGIFAVSITDNSATHFGINYFVEYADNPGFDNAKTIHLGPARDLEGLALGNVTRYFRAFSQYQNSSPSPRVIFGGVASPIGVAGGGSAPPTPLPTQGSGTGHGGGFGGTTPRVPIAPNKSTPRI